MGLGRQCRERGGAISDGTPSGLCSRYQMAPVFGRAQGVSEVPIPGEVAETETQVQVRAAELFGLLAENEAAYESPSGTVSNGPLTMIVSFYHFSVCKRCQLNFAIMKNRAIASLCQLMALLGLL